MENAGGQRVKGSPVGALVYEFVSREEIDNSVKRFGKKFRHDVAMRHVKPGMSREMVIAAWGEPMYKRSNEAQGLSREYWRFTDGGSVEMENGTVVIVYH